MKNLAIFGLGNPGEKYQQNRHNIGFLVLNQLAQQESWKIDTKLESTIISLPYYKGGPGRVITKKSKSLFLSKPTTFMNNSGQAISKVMKYYDIPKEDILIIHDDLDLPFGSIRFSKDSGPAGHNGVKSIIEHLGTQDFTRLRIGIANEIYSKQNIPSEKFVLENFNSEEKTALKENLLQEISKAIEFYIENGYEKTKSEFSIKK